MHKVKVNNEWKNVKDAFVKINGSWKKVKEINTKINGQWRKVKSNLKLIESYFGTWNTPNSSEIEFSLSFARARVGDTRSASVTKELTTGFEASFAVDLTNKNTLSIDWEYTGSSIYQGSARVLIQDIGTVYQQDWHFSRRVDNINISTINGFKKFWIMAHRHTDAIAGVWKEIKIYSVKIDGVEIWNPSNN